MATRKITFHAMILGPIKPGRTQRCVVFTEFEAAQRWCAKHSELRKCNSQIVRVSPGTSGRVIWRYHGAPKAVVRRSRLDPATPE